MMLKLVALIVLLVAIQSCSKENDLPIINEENKIRQAEKRVKEREEADIAYKLSMLNKLALEIGKTVQ